MVLHVWVGEGRGWRLSTSSCLLLSQRTLKTQAWGSLAMRIFRQTEITWREFPVSHPIAHKHVQHHFYKSRGKTQPSVPCLLSSDLYLLISVGQSSNYYLKRWSWVLTELRGNDPLKIASSDVALFNKMTLDKSYHCTCVFFPPLRQKRLSPSHRSRDLLEMAQLLVGLALKPRCPPAWRA